MFCILASCSIFEPNLYTYIALFSLGCQTKLEGWGVSVLQVMKHISTLGSQCPWLQYDRLLALISFVAFIHIELQTWPLRPSRIEMRNWWPEGRGPHSLESITWLGEWPCSHLLENSMPYTACPLLLSIAGFCRKQWPVDHRQCRPTIGGWLVVQHLADKPIHMAGGTLNWPVTFQGDQESVQRCPKNFTVFRGSGQCKQRQQCYGSEFPGETCQARSIHAPRGRAAGIFLLHLIC